MGRSGISEGQSDAVGSDRATWVAFFLMALFAGGNAVAVRISNSGLPPFWGATLRIAAAALVFWILVLVRRTALPRGRALLGVLLYGIVGTGAAYGFVYWGLLRAPASLAGAVLAFVPLLTLIFAWVHALESFRWRGLIGALIATGGILVTVVGGLAGSVHLPSLLALVAGAACLAESAVIFKLFPQSPPMVTNAVSLSAGAPILIILSLVAGEPWRLPATANTWAAFAYLVTVGSVGVFYLYLYILARWTASKTSYVFLIIPVATVVIAALVAGEAITVPFAIGGVLVLAGVWVGAIHRSPGVAELTCSETPNKAIC